METQTKEEGKGKVWLWAILGAIVGYAIGVAILGLIGGIVGGLLVGILAYRSSAKQGGRAPAWLWRTKKK